MGKKAAKATRKFAASGQLKKTIQQRRKHQDIRRKAERRKGTKKGGKDTGRVGDEGEDVEDDEEVEATSSKCVLFRHARGPSVERILDSKACRWTLSSTGPLWREETTRTRCAIHSTNYLQVLLTVLLGHAFRRRQRG